MNHSVWSISLAALIVGCGGSTPAPEAPGPNPPDSTVESVPPGSGGTSTTPVGASPTGAAGTEAALGLPCWKLARNVEGEEDSSRLVRCPAGCSKGGAVWGTDVYTDDSAVCPALVHAGVLPESGGVASVTFVRGLRAYVGSERNGIKSNSYGDWRRSFYGQSLGQDGQPSSPPPTLPAANTARVDCSHRGTVVGGKPGSSLIIICPAGCAERSYSVWGSNPYTLDSNVCASAVHAGIIPSGGGRALVTISAGEPSYAASKKNGVEGRQYGRYGSSFTVASPPVTP
jgi:LCCL domain